MAMIRLGNWGIATDSESAAQIARAGSRAQYAVDRRIRLRILPYIEAALADSDVIRHAAIIAIDQALDTLGVSTPHLSVDDDGTPYVAAGSRTQQVGLDTDGVPAIM